MADLGSLTLEVEVIWAVPQPSGLAPCCAMDLPWPCHGPSEKMCWLISVGLEALLRN